MMLLVHEFCVIELALLLRKFNFLSRPSIDCNMVMRGLGRELAFNLNHNLYVVDS